MINQEQINKVIELAKEIQSPRLASGKNPFAERMAPILDFPESKHFLIRLMDVAFRSHNFDRISAYVLRLFNSTNAHKPLFNTTESIMVRLFRIIGYKLPSVSIPLMLDQIQQVTSPVVFFTGSKKFEQHVEKRKKHGITLNINPIGETLIGEEEAKERLQKYIKVLNNDSVDYVSVKLSTLHSQLIAIAHDEVIEECVERLSILYSEVLKIEQKTGRQKFVNLDMEEYRDLSITLETFMKTLDKPEFKNIRAGIVLQAYLPDTFNEAIRLRDWAKKRVENGGSPVKVRVVKGANLEMEKTESSLHGWPVAPYSTKLDTDANYKKILIELIQNGSAEFLNIGVASHNIFDLAFCLNLVLEKQLNDYVDFEMLEGMAKATVIEINKKGANVILYTPIVEKENYINAIAYLVRRLDEGTQPGNFLKEGFNLEIDSVKWNELKNHFISSLERINEVSIEPNRIQNRLIETHEIQECFKNTPDTDWTIQSNRIWLKEIKEEWENSPNLKTIPVVGLINNKQHTQITQSNWQKELRWKYEIASEEDYEKMIYTNSSWYDLSSLERAQYFKKAAVIMAQRRADLIGVAVAELGKIPSEVDVEVSEAIDFANYYAKSILDLDSENVRYKNAGINLVLSPWNFPIAIPVGGVLASLAAGKRVILKPSQNAAACAYLISQCLWDAGIPKDAFAFLPCKEETLDTYLFSGSVFDAVILTGGTDTANFLLKRNPYLNLYAETGGKNATIVTALADREQAIKNVVQSAFGNSGQKCSATSLLVLEKEVFNDEKFKALLKDAAESKTFGSPWDTKTQIGPLAVPVNEKLRYSIENTKDYQWLLKPTLEGEYLLSPGIKWGITQNDFEYNNELFGPILCVMEANGLGEAIEIVNGTPYGLTSGIESLAREEVRYWKEHIKAGNLYANRSTTGAIVQRQPFGGMKASCFGFGMKAGGENYVRQFINIEPSLIPLSEIEKNYNDIFLSYFNKEIDYSKVRGQHNITRYLKPNEVIIIVDETTQIKNLKMVELACKVIRVKSTIISTNQNLKIDGFNIHYINNLNRIFKDLKPNTVVRSLALKLPNLFMQECHKNNIHVNDRTPHANGRFELLNYLTEQSLSLNYHRYGNLMGEKNFSN